MSAPPTARTESDYRRLRAYEGLLVAIVSVFVAVVVAIPAVVAITAPLRAVGRALTPSP